MNATSLSKLNDLPNEIINQIMRNLEPDDLASLCLVSERFKYLARRHFEQERKNCGFVTIRGDIKGNISFDFEEALNYVKVFSDLIRSVKVFNVMNWENVAHFIQKNCHKELLKNFLSVDVILMNEYRRGVYHKCIISESFGEIIKGQLKSVVMLEIFCIQFDNFYEFLKHCKSLRVLKSDFVDCESGDWMHMRYPNLDILVYRNHSTRNPIEGAFFRNNPQLKGVIIYQPNQSNLLLTETVLPFAMLFYDESYSENQTNLENCLRKKTIKSLDLKAGVDVFSVLKTVGPSNNVRGLHLQMYPSIILRNLILTGSIFPNIRRLCFEIPGYERLGRKDCKKLAKLFPNLHELHIIMSPKTPKQFVDLMEPFLEKLASLKDVYIYHGRYKIFNENSLSSLTSARSKLLNASPVKIHIDRTDVTETGNHLVSNVDPIYE